MAIGARRHKGDTGPGATTDFTQGDAMMLVLAAAISDFENGWCGCQTHTYLFSRHSRVHLVRHLYLIAAQTSSIHLECGAAARTAASVPSPFSSPDGPTLVDTAEASVAAFLRAVTQTSVSKDRSVQLKALESVRWILGDLPSTGGAQVVPAGSGAGSSERGPGRDHPDATADSSDSDNSDDSDDSSDSDNSTDSDGVPTAQAVLPCQVLGFSCAQPVLGPVDHVLPTVTPGSP
jgi:hypothetical protein